MPAKNTLTVLFLGDIVGLPGCRAVLSAVAGLRSQYSADAVIVNGENADNGFGITEEIAGRLFQCGVDVITTGNHIWHDKHIYSWLDHEKRILRPGNYSSSLPGRGLYTFSVRSNTVAVLNVQGRQYMPLIDCPIKYSKEVCRSVRSSCRTIIVDFHGESTLEKEAYAYCMSSEVSAVLGTHTHIQTADERIVNERTAYITDAGACSVADSVIGFNAPASLARFLQQKIGNSVIDDSEPATIKGVVFSIDTETGASKHIERVSVRSRV